MMDLHHNGYNLQDTVIVTDRGYQSIYNIQRLLDIEINYVCGSGNRKTYLADFCEKLSDPETGQ